MEILGNLELQGTTITLKNGAAATQKIVAGTPSVSNVVTLPNETQANTEAVTAYSGNAPDKRVKFDTSGMTGSYTLTLSSVQTSAQTLAIPNVSSSDSLVTNNAAATLLSKTLTDPKLKTSTHELTLSVASGNTSSAVLTLDLSNASKTLTLGGNFTTSGASALTLTTTGATNVTLPTTGTVLSLASDTVTLPNTSNATLTLVNSGTLTLGANISELIITNNLTVNGTTTAINTTTLDVEDSNITVNKNGTQATANASDAGINVEMTDQANPARIFYDSALGSGWAIDKGGGSSAPKELVDVSSAQTLSNKSLTNLAFTRTSSGSVDIIDGTVLYYPAGRIASGHTYTVQSNAFSVGAELHASRSLEVLSGGNLTVNSGGTVYIN